MTKLTQKQFEALRAAFEKGGAHYGRTGNLMGGAYRRMCLRLADDGLVSHKPPFKITTTGLLALRHVYAYRFATNGCEANELDLKKVEAALDRGIESSEG